MSNVLDLLDGLIQFRTKFNDNPLYPDDTKSTVQDVPIKRIVSHQNVVKEHIVKKYQKKPGRVLPIVHKVGSKYIVEDGNHRIVAKKENGEKVVRARVLEQLSTRLDKLIEFGKQDEPAPRIDSWNPWKRSRQHRDLQRWVDTRPPSAGITGEQLEKQYPGHPHRTRHIVGAVVGTTAGAVGGAILSRKLRHGGGAHPPIGTLGALGSIVGGAAGEFVSDPKHYIEKVRGTNQDINDIEEHFRQHSVDVKTIKTPIPIATSHREVAKELKKQGVGFLKRHHAAISTYPVRHSTNAAFVGTGTKGLIVSPEFAPPAFIKHEAGHAKDYAHYGGEQGFDKAYPNYGAFTFPKKPYIHNTLLPEHRAWAHAGKLNKKDQDLRDAALRTYARGGMLLSARERLIQLSAGLKRE